MDGLEYVRSELLANREYFESAVTSRTTQALIGAERAGMPGCGSMRS